MTCFELHLSQTRNDTFSFGFHAMSFTVLCLFTSGGCSQKVGLWKKFQTQILRMTFWPIQKPRGWPLSPPVVFCIFFFSVSWLEISWPQMVKSHSGGAPPAELGSGLSLWGWWLWTEGRGGCCGSQRPLWPRCPLVSHTPLSGSDRLDTFVVKKKHEKKCWFWCVCEGGAKVFYFWKCTNVD